VSADAALVAQIARLQAQFESLEKRLDRAENSRDANFTKIYEKLDRLAKTANIERGRKTLIVSLLTGLAALVGATVNWAISL
jgi:uncharacterized protein YdcH (DUF465 family)